MAIKRYAVIDANGFKVNTILADDASLGSYYPGYGAKMIDEGAQPQEPKAPPAPPRPADFGVLAIVPDQPMEIGDSIDIKTGKVTKAPPNGG